MHKYALLLPIAIAATAMESQAQHSLDKHSGRSEMQAAREALREHMGGQTIAMVFAERLEYQSNEGNPFLLWDVQAWRGGDINKFWVKTEGEYLTVDDSLEEGEFQALYSRSISPYFDLQFGYRYDTEPDPERHFAVLGVQGLAPYWFEIDAALFVSHDGDVSARLEAEYELFLTQRLILQPRTELEFAVQDVPELGIGSGLGSLEAEVRLRYEFRREFAPYVGASWRGAIGETADFARADGDDVRTVSFVAGFRFWL